MITFALLAISCILTVITAVQVWRDVSYIRSERYRWDIAHGVETFYPWAPWFRMAVVFWIFTITSLVLGLIFS